MDYRPPANQTERDTAMRAEHLRMAALYVRIGDTRNAKAAQDAADRCAARLERKA